MKRDWKAKETKPSECARRYTVKHVPEMFATGRGFTDARGVKYLVAPDGSLRRAKPKMKSRPADTDPIEKPKRRGDNLNGTTN